MDKRICAWIVLIGCELSATASGFSADDYAAAGRMHISQWTATGIGHACEILDRATADANCPECHTDRELIFLRAMAKTAMLFLDHDEVLHAKDLLDLADGFGLTLAANAFHDLAMRDAADPIGPAPLPPEGDPNQVRRLLSESILPQLDEIVTELDSIADGPEPFVMVMSPEETGLVGDLEIDYSDVLILKGLLLAYQGVLETRIACERQPYVYRGVGDLPSVGRSASDGGLLVEWAKRLSAPPSDGFDEWLATTEQAQQHWIDAITQYVDALECMALENCPPGADPQEDELTYIDPSTLPHLDVYTSVLTTLRRSLQRDAVAPEAIVTTRTYEVHGTDAAPLGRLVLVFDGARFEGRRGTLTLVGGDVLDIDWFGLLDGQNVGISLFSPDHGVEAWLEGAIDSDRAVIAEASLDLWGADRQGAQRQTVAADDTRQVAIGRLWSPHHLDEWFTTTYLTD